MRTKKQESRRGVTLLFTISMIVLFLLMGTTFVVVANDFYKTSVRRSRLNTYKVDATALLDQAFKDVFRGVDLSDSSSPLRTHSILEDQYGYGYSASAESCGGGAIAGLQVVTIADLASIVEVRDGFTPFDFAADYADGIFSGCVLSVVSGAAEGYSGRIVSTYLSGTGLLLVVPTDTEGIDLTSIASGDRILINGRDFSGTGAGNIAGTPDLDALTPAALVGAGILTPNRKGQPRNTLLNGDNITDPMNPIESYISSNHSTNEPYDIADENNWFLAGVDAGGDIIPSFHRDQAYTTGLTTVGTTAADISGFSFRPVYVDSDNRSSAQYSGTADEPFFGEFEDDGALSNAVNNEDGLDVDTDGDGEADAVWIDIGLPLQTDSEGRQFKPLVAYRIIDMDGRLNLNAHGSYADSELGATARRGGSYGVAEVTLADAFGGANYNSLLNLRSGNDGTGNPQVPGNPDNSIRAGQTLFGYPDFDRHTGDRLLGTGLFASGADIFGKSVVGRNVAFYGADSLQGFSMYSSFANAPSAVTPYSADLSLGGGVGDSQFQAFELEPLLRPNDIDSDLIVSRLRGVGALETNIDAVTTDSAEIAMPPSSVVELLWDACGNDLMIYRDLVSAGYLSEEVLMGGLYDLNQPTGNGVDEDDDGIVDEPDELMAETQASARHDGLAFDLDNGGNGMAGDGLARQRKANQLYILALLVTQDTTPPMFAGEFTTAADYRRAVAQWAVNIVDFIDSDSIMTAFEYDINPFNDVIPDGDPATDDETSGTGEGFIVFGAERPELLITETFASHSRNNQDLDTDTSGDDLAGGDNDWDSGHLPESSFFIELYNPWTQLDPLNAARIGAPAVNATQVPPAELYAAQPRGGVDFYGVELQRTAGTSPVWRIGVKREETDAAFLRTIFFTPITASTPAGVRLAGTSDNYYPSGSATLQVVEPGGYFVVGPSGNAGGGVSTFGRLSSGVDVATTRRIVLDGASSPNTIGIYDPDNPLTLPSNTMATPIACGVAVVDSAFSVTNGTQTRSLSLTVPDGGYTIPATTVQTPEPDGILLAPALDTPLDANAGLGRNAADLSSIWTNGVSDAFRFVYLQRLADPTSAFDAQSNPYITIDSAEVDLVAFNGLNADATNSDSIETGAGTANFFTANGTPSTALKSSERGENRDNIGVARDATHVGPARRTFFRTADIEPAASFINANTGATAGDGHNFSFGFFDLTTGRPLISLGDRNESIGGSFNYPPNLPTDPGLPNIPGSDQPLGDLVWLNRPLANKMELVHVPLMTNGGVDAEQMETLLDTFNRCRAIDDIPALRTAPAPQEVFAYYFGDDKFGHLMGFGGMSPANAGAGEMNGGGMAAPSRRIATRANRFDVLLDYVNVPSKFQGLRKWLAAGVTAAPGANGMIFNMHAPYNSIPSFREPGKININTMSEAVVHNGMVGGFSAIASNYNYIRDVREATGSLTDYGGRFIPGASAQNVYEEARSNAQGNFFRRSTTDTTQRIFDYMATGPGNENSDTNTSSWYENEFRQRLGSVATTRSSVFSIWVTVGYFEVDEYGRIGRELGSDEGEVQRNRAFYMVDRSIPVACEPGRDHNVDKAVLVRTIIE